MFARYQLGQIYASLRTAVVRGRWDQATELLAQALGMDLPGRPGHREIVQALRHHCIRQLSYQGFKPAELAMLYGGIKPVVKMEDLPIAQARQWLAHAPNDLYGELGEPYRKDYLLLRSSPCSATDPLALVCLYAGKAAAVAELRATETLAREDAQAAGRVLAIPSCCSQAFAADFARSRQDQDAVNDDATRRLLSTATPVDPAPWQLNPLSDFELLGYYPCSLQCLPSRRRAATVYEQLRQRDFAQASSAATRLARPTLFWRLPFFAVVDGHWQLGTAPADATPGPQGPQGQQGATADRPVLSYRSVRFNVFADPVVQSIQALLAAHLLPSLTGGDSLSVDQSGLTIRSGRQTIAHFSSTNGEPPLLTAWSSPAP